MTNKENFLTTNSALINKACKMLNKISSINTSYSITLKCNALETLRMKYHPSVSSFIDKIVFNQNSKIEPKHIVDFCVDNNIKYGTKLIPISAIEEMYNEIAIHLNWKS